MDVIFIIGVIQVLAITTFILLFVVLQARKGRKLLLSHQQTNFQREILRAQAEIKEETLRSISAELHDNVCQLLCVAELQARGLAADVPDSS